MFGIGWGEIFIIMIVALLAIGPEKLPEVARSLAKIIRYVQRLAHDVRNSVELDELTRPQQPYRPPPVTPMEGSGTVAAEPSTTPPPTVTPTASATAGEQNAGTPPSH